MRHPRTSLVALGVLAILAGCRPSPTENGEAAETTAAVATPDEPCDRACLEGLVEQYFDAMIAHDPAQVPLTDDFRMTENGQRLPLGDALWKTMTAKGAYRLFVSDAEAGQVAVIGTVVEQSNAPGGAPAAIALRLEVEDRQIAEAETLIVRPGTGFGNPAGVMEELGQPNPVFLQPIAEDQRMSRDELIRVANMYFSGMEQNDGMDEYPFTGDCDRFENGVKSTNAPTPPGETRPDPATANSYSDQWGCLEQFESGLIHFVWRIRDRRFVAVDPEYGLVFSFVFFDHALGEDRTYQTPDGRTVTGGPIDPYTWQIAELFRIENGLIRRIEAILIRSPYGMNSGWSTYEEGISSEMRDVTGL
jgi:hypothetical protein